MGTNAAAQTPSERKRISVPRADESVLDWWELQHDPGLSIRTLIRAEIERSGYVDAVFRPVSQQPRRGRPPGSAIEPEPAAEHPVPVSPVVSAPAPTTQPAAAPTPIESAPASSGLSAIELIMNG